MLKYSFLFLVLLSALGLHAQQLTLEDLLVKRTYSQKSVTGLASMNDGLHFTTLEN
jgi:dipeptidyl-peptidase-4